MNESHAEATVVVTWANDAAQAVIRTEAVVVGDKAAIIIHLKAAVRRNRYQSAITRELIGNVLNEAAMEILLVARPFDPTRSKECQPWYRLRIEASSRKSKHRSAVIDF